ncbi:MAG: hypothetical protein JEZ00_17800 [Anaerolineaceae bacterium]|nr:hypothetical protein [Anaerolineaceae bacterium]
MYILNSLLFIFYKYVYPAFLIIGLMVVAQFNEHPPRTSDHFIDFLLRLVLTLFFYKYFTSMTNDKKMHLEKYFDYDDGITVKIILSSFGIFSSVLISYIAYGILQDFFNFNEPVDKTVAIFHGVINLIPLIFRLPNSKYGNIFEKKIHNDVFIYLKEKS